MRAAAALVAVWCFCAAALAPAAQAASAAAGASPAVDARLPAPNAFEVNEKYASFNVDSTFNRGFFHVDFANTALRAAASSLAPATLRVGGTGGDYLHYGGFAGSEPCPAASSSANDTYGCLNTTHWADLVGLADTVGDLLFGLSYDAERACGGGAGAGAAYEWRADAAQGALRLLRHAAASGQRIWGVELGNELNNLNRADRQACGLRAEHHAEALITLQKVLEGVYQNASDRPVVIGPDSGGYECIGVGGCPWLEDCLDALRASERGVDGTLHAVTHHTYPGIASDSYDSASELDQKHAIDQWLVPLVRQRAAKAQVWSGETGPHSGGENGTCGADAASICGKFGSALWYADDLGYRATRGISQHQRQDLFGGRYGLLRIKRGAEALFADDSVSLSADFWVNYLWKRLVGRAVGGTVLEETYGNTLRAYCHAGAPQSPDAPPEAAGATATLVLINLSPSEGREVTLGVAPLGGGRTTVDALAWSLSPPIAGALSFDAPLLNGQALPAALTVGGKGLAGMQAPAKRIPAGGTIALPPHSVTFALLLDSKSRAMSFATSATGGWDRSNLEHKLFFFARTRREQWTRAQWGEEAVLWLVFAATGSTASKLAKHAVHGTGLEGNLRDGPWAYRGAYVVTTLPIYTALLVGFGTAARRGAYFQRFARRMWSRMLPMGK